MKGRERKGTKMVWGWKGTGMGTMEDGLVVQRSKIKQEADDSSRVVGERG